MKKLMAREVEDPCVSIPFIKWLIASFNTTYKKNLRDEMPSVGTRVTFVAEKGAEDRLPACEEFYNKNMDEVS